MPSSYVSSVQANSLILFHVAKFEGSLGQVSVGSVFHPREVVQVGDSGKPKGPVSLFFVEAHLLMIQCYYWKNLHKLNFIFTG